MKTTSYLMATAGLLGCALWAAEADVLELKNGKTLNGKYVGGTAGTVRFETTAGVQVIETAQTIALTFTAPAATPSAPAKASPAPAAAAQSTAMTLPAGTMLLVRMVDSVSSQNSAGSTFTTKLEYDLAAGGNSVIKAGTLIYGKVQSSTQARRAVGKSTIDLRLTQMVVNGKPLPIATSGYKEAGEASVKKAARGAAGGAAIGAIVDGGDGAGKGAAIGATASLLKKGETVTVPPGVLLEFNLTQPVTIQ
jgi:hypothetical protein